MLDSTVYEIVLYMLHACIVDANIISFLLLYCQLHG